MNIDSDVPNHIEKTTWNKTTIYSVASFSTIVASALTGGLALAFITSVAAILGVTLGAGALVGGASAFWARRKLRLLKTQETPLSKIAEKTAQHFGIPGSKRVKLPQGKWMGHRLAAHFLGGGFVHRASVDHEKLEGCNFLSVFSVAKHILSKKKFQAYKELSPILKGINSVMEVEKQLKHFTSKETEAEKVQDKGHQFAIWFILEKLLKAEEGDTILIPGGWTGMRGVLEGHAMLYEFIKQGNGKFTMRVYNSGSGIENHPSAHIQHKLKFLPFIEQQNIDLETLCKPAIWITYFEYTTLQPSNVLDTYNDKDIYEGFLKTIHPNFGKEFIEEQDFNPDYYITPQSIGTCTGDVLYAYMHAHLNKGLYKAIKNEMQFHVFGYYFNFLQNRIENNIFDEKQKVELSDITTRLGLIEFLKANVNKYALSTKKGLQEGWISKKMGLKRKQACSELLSLLNKAELRHQSRLALTSPLLHVNMLEQEKLLQEKQPYKNIDQASEKLKSNLLAQKVTRPSPQELALELTRFNTDISKIEAEFEINKGEIHYFVKRLFDALPSVTSTYWDEIPVKDRENCMSQLAKLTEWLFLSKPNIMVLDDLFYTQKILAITKKLSLELPDDSDGIKDLDLDLSYLTHDPRFKPKTGYLPITDPKMAEELAEAVSFLGKTSNLDSGYGYGFFFSRDLEAITESEVRKALAFSERPRNELEYVSHYLGHHPEVQVKIKEALTKEFGEKDYDFHILVAKALTDINGQFLPPAYCHLKKVAFLTQSFMKDTLKYQPILKLKEEPKIDRIKGLGFVKESLGLKARYPEFSNGRMMHVMYHGYYNNYIKLGHPKHHQAFQEGIVADDKELFEELQFLSSEDDKGHQIYKTISFLKENPDKLKHPEMQKIVESLLFELNMLHFNLAVDPNLSVSLATFINQMYERTKNNNDVSTAIFLLRMGTHVARYLAFYQFNDAQKLLPNFLDELDQWSKKKGLSRNHQSLILREFLAAAYRNPSNKMDDSDILNKAIKLTNHAVDKNSPYAYAPHLDTDVSQLYSDLARRMIHYPKEKRNEVLSKAIAPDHPVIEWEMSGSVCASSNGRYQIDLLNCQLYIDGSIASFLPAAIEKDPDFIKLFKGKEFIQDIRTKGPELCFFRDQFGYENRVNYVNHYNKIYQKKINGIWCQQYPPKDLDSTIRRSSLSLCDCWYDPSNDELHFINPRGEIVYVYNFKETSLRCIEEGIKNGLRLIPFDNSRGYQTYFKSFDSYAEFWKDSHDKLKLIHLPTYQLSFEIEQPSHSIRLIPKQEGYRLAKNPFIPILNKLPSYLLLENKEGQKKVILPRKVFETEKSFTNKLKYSDFILEEAPHYYSYTFDKKGNLTSDSLSARLYLVYIHSFHRSGENYKQAFKILSEKADKLSEYSAEEKGLLKLIMLVYSFTEDMDTRASAIRLKAHLLLQQNKKNYHDQSQQKTPEQIEIDKIEQRNWKDLDEFNLNVERDIVNYIQGLAHTSFATLSPKDEVVLLTGYDDLLVKRRLQYLTGEPSRERMIEYVEKEKQKASLKEKVLENAFPDQWVDHPLKADTLTRPSHFDKNFLKYYKMATSIQPNSREAKALLQTCQMARSRYTIYLAQIIQAVILSPDTFPTFEQLQEKIKKDKAVKIFEELYSKASTVLSRPSHLYVYEQELPPQKTDFLLPAIIPLQPSTVTQNPILGQHISPGNERESIQRLKGELQEVHKRREDLFKQASTGKKNKYARQLRALEKEEARLMSQIAFLEEKDILNKLAKKNAKNTPYFNEVTHAGEKREDISDQVRTKLKQRGEATKNPHVLRGIEKLIYDYEHLTETSPVSHVIPIEKIQPLKEDLEAQFKLSAIHQEQFKRRILEIANKMSLDPEKRQIEHLEFLGEQRKLIKFEDLERLLVHHDYNEFRKLNSNLKQEDALLLCQMTTEFLVKETRQLQIQKALKEITALQSLLSDTPEADHAIKEKMETLFKILSLERSYNPHEHPEFLVFEKRADILITPEQVEKLSLLLQKDKSLIVQMIMGAGKSSVLLPLLALAQADGEHLSILMIPSFLMDQASQNTQMRSGEIFHQAANRIDWSNTTLEGLQNTLSRLEEIISSRSYLLVTDLDMHLFHLFSRELRQYCCEHGSLSEEDQAKYETVVKIKNLLKEKGKVIADEIDPILSPRDEVHLARGNAKEINKEYSRISQFIFLHLLSDPTITKKVYFDFTQDPDPKAIPYTSNHYPGLRKVLCQRMFDRLQKRIQGRFTEQEMSQIQEYLFIDEKEMSKRGIKKLTLPDSLSLDEKNELTFLRQELHIFLPLTLNSICDENYGKFPNSPKLSKAQRYLAGPYAGVDQAKIGSQFAAYAEQINYTRQLYAKKGVSLEILKQELIRIRTAIETECTRKNVDSSENTDAYQEYISLCGADFAKKYQILQMNDDSLDDVTKDLAKEINQSQKLIQKFVNKFVLPMIIYYDTRLSSHAQRLPSLFKEMKGFSGTMNGEGTFHPMFTVMPQKGIDSKILNILAENSLDEIYCLSEKNPDALITKLMSQPNANEFFALIDQGGLTKEMSGLLLAKRILELRPDLDAVVYFEGDRRMILKRSVGQPLSHTPQNDVAPNKRFSIYDQVHCRGTHVDQHFSARAWITENKNGTLKRSEQAIFRMRKIGISQKTTFIVQDDLYTSLQRQSQSEKPDIIDFVIYLKANQEADEAEDHLMSLNQKIENLLFQTCDSVLNKITPDKLSRPVNRELDRLFIKTIKDSPYEQLGEITGLDDAINVLNGYKESMLAGVRKWKETFKDEPIVDEIDIDSLENEMDKLIHEAISRKFVADKLPGSETIANESNQTVQVAVQQQQKEQQKVEESITPDIKQDLDTTQKKLMPYIAGGMIRVDEMFSHAFFESIPFEKLSAMNIAAINAQKNCWMSLKGIFQEKEKPPAITDWLFNKMDMQVPFELVFTANEDTEPFGPYQKPFGSCLIVRDKKTGQLEFRPLDPKNCEDLRLSLISDKLKPFETQRDKQLCLYHPDFGVYQQGSDPIDVKELMDDPQFFQLQLIFKLISGKINGYSKKELEYLQQKIKELPSIEEAKQFFFKYFIKKQNSRKNFPFSELGRLFAGKEKAPTKIPQKEAVRGKERPDFPGLGLGV